jgi:heme exporter protein A
VSSLRFEAVSCLRGGRLLFESVSFALRAGEAALVTGPNGAGKSSLLRIAAGLLDAAAGSVARDGAVALADENTALDRDLPLGRALGFWAGLDRGANPSAAMDATGLTHLAPVPVRMLSTGQRKRAALARVIASGAPIWLLDEPTNGLDAEAIGRLEGACATHQAGGGIVLAATHQSFGIEAVTIPLVPSVVEGRNPEPATRPSTSLGTNGEGLD